MIFAVSMPHSPVGSFVSNSVLEKVRQELLTPYGLRSLSPKNTDYKGKYAGNQVDRDLAYHQGTVWPWLLGAFADAFLKLHGATGKAFIESIYRNFEQEMFQNGIGTVSEVYDGDPPHEDGGAFSQAWNVAELLRIKWMLDNI
jgi:glycogen debranching enzyme